MRPMAAAFIISLTLLAAFVALSDSSEADFDCYTYDPETGTLTITGDVPDMDSSTSDAPWALYASEVRSIVVGKDVQR